MSDIEYAHEDELQEILGEDLMDGKTPVYLLYSCDDEAVFVSRKRITVPRLKKELKGHELFITGTAELD